MGVMRGARVEAVSCPDQAPEHAQEDQEMFQHGCAPVATSVPEKWWESAARPPQASLAVSAARPCRLTPVACCCAVRPLAVHPSGMAVACVALEASSPVAVTPEASALRHLSKRSG